MLQSSVVKPDLTPERSPQIWEICSCLFCGPGPVEQVFQAADYLNGVPGLFSVVRCQTCDFVFQNPRPRPEFIGRFYHDDAAYYKTGTPPSRESKKRLLSHAVLASYFGYEHLNPVRSKWLQSLIKAATFPLYLFVFRVQTIPHFKKNGTLLEIGCSYGFRLEKDRNRGWNVVGNELNAAAAERGRSEKKLEIHTGSIFDMEFAPESFDAIVMDMVLEHVYEPERLIALVHTWLKPGGEFLFSIPYFEGFEFRIFKEYAYGVQVPTHLHFFNKKHLRKLLNRFSSTRFIFQHVDRDVVGSAACRFYDKKSTWDRVLAWNKLLRWVVIKPFVFVMALLGQTSRVTVRAIK